MDKKEQKNKEELSQIHLWIPKNLKLDWKEQFKQRGHNTLKSGIVAAVFNYLYLPHLHSPEIDKILEELKSFLETFEIIERRLEEKADTIQNINYEISEDFINSQDYEKTKVLVLEKLEMYQPIAITFLSQVTKIPGPTLLPILKKMKENNLIILTDKYEWCLK